MRVQICVIMSFGHRCVLDLAWCSPFECGRSPNSLIPLLWKRARAGFRSRLKLTDVCFSRSLRRTHRRTIKTSSAIGEALERRHYRWMDCDVALSCVFTHLFFPLYSFFLFSLHRIPFDSKMCSQRKFIRHRHQVLLFAFLRYHSVSTVPMCAGIDAVRTSRPSSKMFTFRTNNGNARAR